MLNCLYSLYTDPFIISEDDNFFSFPIGATIDLQFVRADGGIIDGSGFDMATFELFPELHTPLQQPNIAYSVDLFVSVRYTSASPSLTGDYVLCSQDETPFLCGGQITLDITSKLCLFFWIYSMPQQLIFFCSTFSVYLNWVAGVSVCGRH